MSSSHSGKLAGKSLGLTQSPCSRQMTLSPAAAAVWVTTAPDGPAPMTNTSTISAVSLGSWDATIRPHFLSDSAAVGCATSIVVGTCMVSTIGGGRGPGEDLRPCQYAAVDDEGGPGDRGGVIRSHERHGVGDPERFDGAPHGATHAQLV